MLLRAIAVLCSTLVVPGDVGLYAQSSPQPLSAQGETAPLTPAELESLVAPIALYPDPLVAQILAATTDPLEIVEARSWLKKNSGLKCQDLVQAAAKQNWDPSTQALVVFRAPYFRRAVPCSSAAVADRYGAGRAVATPYGAAAGVRTPRGAAGAISGLNGAAAGIRTSGAAAGAISGPNGAAAEIRTPRGSAGAVTAPNGSAARIQRPQCPAIKTPRVTYTNPKPNAFEGDPTPK